jgi:hypothetical protein
MNPHDHSPRRTQGSAPQELDQMLAVHFASDEELAPSSGFTLSVMEALHAETGAPPPLPFPWRRVVPGLIAVLCVMAAFGIFALRELRGIAAPGTGSQHGLAASLGSMPQMHFTPLEQALCWIGASVCLSVAVAAGSMRLVKK